MNTGNPPPLKPVQPAKALLSPMVLSALVYPGAGQLMQRRWWVGAFFVMGSTLAVGWLATAVFVVLKAYYGMAFDSAPVETPRLASLLIPFFIWLGIYIAGIVDTAIASYRLQVTRQP